ncbi:MAG: hypothetical protein ABEI52_11890 [Halobacteriaceae archaeon]
MARTQEYTAKEVAEAIRQANGVVKTAALQLGCTPATVYNYADRYVTVQEALDESRKDIAGEAEGYLIAMMRDREHPKHYKAVTDILRMYHPDDFTDQKTKNEHSGPDRPVEVVFDSDVPEPDGE